MDKNQNLSLYRKKDKMPISNVLIEPQNEKKKKFIRITELHSFYIFKLMSDPLRGYSFKPKTKLTLSC